MPDIHPNALPDVSALGAWPDDSGAASGDVLTTNGSGTFSWTAPSAAGVGFAELFLLMGG
jgi:hypothetical protein